MIYIIVALKSEAQAFVDKYKLKKSRLSGFLVFSNATMKLIVSGVGVGFARDATQTFINHYDITDDDIYLNVGICGGDKNYEIGTLVEVGSVTYEGIKYTLKENKKQIHTLDKEMTQEGFELVDMEAYGFYDAVVHNPAIRNAYIFKVVSDHFEPKLITKEKTKALIFDKIDAINKIIKI
ncbi:hypothetical protein [Sulfurimonas sp.]|uniref:hypothetical protein n=1 Tax=Sulfurimonas sp. TaxID=2022749 RepID=UPI0025DD7526|nr:hypothetical protein [Sulfurimonas sp.]MBT5935868.1 hypothetical protein [Sulfurimonas sp.]